jgi:hypothetical protein
MIVDVDVINRNHVVNWPESFVIWNLDTDRYMTATPVLNMLCLNEIVFILYESNIS